jgi:hypothetical protein
VVCLEHFPEESFFRLLPVLVDVRGQGLGGIAFTSPFALLRLLSFSLCAPFRPLRSGRGNDRDGKTGVQWKTGNLKWHDQRGDPTNTSKVVYRLWQRTHVVLWGTRLLILPHYREG